MDDFIYHWYKGELDEAKKYATPESRDFIELIKAMITPQELQRMQDTEVSLTHGGKEIINDSVIRYNCDVYLDSVHNNVSFYLNRVEGKWYVNIMN